jgi:hypothetical protein
MHASPHVNGRLWLTRRGVGPGGLDFDQGGTASLPTPLPPSTQLARRNSPPHPATRPSRRPIRPKRAAMSCLFRAKRGSATLPALKIGRSREF